MTRSLTKTVRSLTVRSLLVAAVAAVGLTHVNTARADEFSFHLSIVDDCPLDRVWIEPVYETRSRVVWVEPVSEVRIDREWVEPIYETRCEKVWVPDEFRTVVERRRDPCGRVVVVSREVLVRPGYWTTRQTQVVVREGFWQERPVTVCVSEGYFKTIEEQVCVRPGYWATRPGSSLEFGFRVNDDHDDYRPRHRPRVPDNFQRHGGDRFDWNLDNASDRRHDDQGDRFRDRPDTRNNFRDQARLADRDYSDRGDHRSRYNDLSRDQADDRVRVRHAGDEPRERSADRGGRSDRGADRGDRYRS